MTGPSFGVLIVLLLAAMLIGWRVLRFHHTWDVTGYDAEGHEVWTCRHCPKRRINDSR